MALFLRQRLPVAASAFSKLLLRPTPICAESEQVRSASKKAGGTTRNRRGRAKPKYRGWKVQDGEFINEGDIIATQYGLRWYPGENVLIDEKLTMKAAYDGIVLHTTEELNPHPESPLFTPVQNGLKIRKRFFHVIPTPLHGKFRLISQT